MQYGETYTQISQHVDWLYRWSQKKEILTSGQTHTDTHMHVNIHVNIQPDRLLYALWLLEYYHVKVQNCTEDSDNDNDCTTTTIHGYVSYCGYCLLTYIVLFTYLLYVIVANAVSKPVPVIGFV